jgi:hypothetical protein
MQRKFHLFARPCGLIEVRFLHYSKKMKHLKIKDFGLSIALFFLFLFSIIGHSVFGFYTYNEEQIANGLSPLTFLTDYLTTGHFISTFSENMESEFLQMALFVFLTMCLYQRGSSESNKQPDEKSEYDKKRERQELEFNLFKRKTNRFWPIYENSLSLALFSLFLFSFFLHSWGSFQRINQKNLQDHLPMISYSEVFKESEFWFESFQNWQSEFFSVAVLIILSIFLRQNGSSQSKKMDDPIWKTGSS